MKTKYRSTSAALALTGSVLALFPACGAQAPEEPEPVGTVEEPFNPSSAPNQPKGHVLITKKAFDVLSDRGLLPPLLQDANNQALVIYGNNFGDHPEANWPVVGGGESTTPVVNHMTNLVPLGGSYKLRDVRGHFSFGFDSPSSPVGLLFTMEPTATLQWTRGPNSWTPRSATLKYLLNIHFDVDAAGITVREKDKPYEYAVDNMYHYALGDLRDFNDPSIGDGETKIRFFPLDDEHLISEIEEPYPTHVVTENLRHQALLADADFGVSRYGAILYQVARRFFPGSFLPAPNLADLVKAGNDVPGWRTGRLEGRGQFNELQLEFPHTYLGGMPNLCIPANSADPCATGTPVWPSFIINRTTAPSAADLGQVTAQVAPRSNRAGLIYLGWATHMIQDASAPHHAANWTGFEHENQDGIGDQLCMYDDYTGQTQVKKNCKTTCIKGGCFTQCGPDSIVPHYCSFSPEWSIEAELNQEINTLMGPPGAAKPRSEICRSLGITDEASSGGLNWEAVHPVFLGNLKRAYYSRKEKLRGDDIRVYGKRMVRNAIVGTAKLLLCGVPGSAPVTPASPTTARVRLFEGSNASGRAQTLQPGIYDAAMAGPRSLRSVGNNAASSINIPSTDYSVVLFDQSGLTGSSEHYTWNPGTSNFGLLQNATTSVFVTRGGESGTFNLRFKRDFVDSGAVRTYDNERYLYAPETSEWGRLAMSTSHAPFATSWRYDPYSRAIKNQSGLCLDVQWNNSADGTPVHMWGCNGGTAQQWELLPTGQITNANGKCITFGYNSNSLAGFITQMETNTTATMWSCGVPDAQSFQLVYGCSHDQCTTGAPLAAACSTDVADVCATDPYCCQTNWDSNCVNALPTKCDWRRDMPYGFAARRPSECGTLRTDDGLVPGQVLKSCDGRFSLHFQAHGDVSLYTQITFNPPPPPPAPSGTSVWLWSTNTYSNEPTMFIMQSDGNLVLYDVNGVPLWASGTVGNYGAYAKLHDDGNLAIYDASNRQIWATNTRF